MQWIRTLVTSTFVTKSRRSASVMPCGEVSSPDAASRTASMSKSSFSYWRNFCRMRGMILQHMGRLGRAIRSERARSTRPNERIFTHHTQQNTIDPTSKRIARPPPSDLPLWSILELCGSSRNGEPGFDMVNFLLGATRVFAHLGPAVY